MGKQQKPNPTFVTVALEFIIIETHVEENGRICCGSIFYETSSVKFE